jgi:hypothetical protein
MTPTPREGISMTFDLDPAHTLRSPRLRELFALARETGATMTAPNGSENGSENGENGSSSEENENSENENGENGENGSENEKLSWADWVAALPDDQQAMVQAEIERREKETRKARNEARNLRTRAQEAEAKAAENGKAVEDKDKSVEQTNELTKTLRSENQGLRQRLVTQEIKVQAASMFADPDDPAELLSSQVSDFMDDDLEPDSQAISDALKDLLERKPHLAKAESKPRPPAASKAQGSSGSQTSSPGSKGAAEAARRFANRPAPFGQKQAS